MEIVIALHPDQELILVRSQKTIISSLFEKGKIIYASMPLWIPTAFNSVQEAKKQITGITINAPLYDMEKGCLSCPVLIKTKRGDFKSSLAFVKGQLDPALTLENKKPFPLKVKIFRLGECSSPSPNYYELKNIVWKKL